MQRNFASVLVTRDEVVIPAATYRELLERCGELAPLTGADRCPYCWAALQIDGGAHAPGCGGGK